MTLDQIAKEMVTSKAELRRQEYAGRRDFYARALVEGHHINEIASYVDRWTVAVKHALRMHCMDTFGGPYDRSVEEMRDAMGRVGA